MWYWHRRADERLGNPPQAGSRSLYWSEIRDGRPPRGPPGGALPQCM